MKKLFDEYPAFCRMRTIQAYYEEASGEYPKCGLSAETAAAIPCRQVLGAYIVRFTRNGHH